MAGIGFELKKLVSQDNYTGLIRAYGYAAVISSGPWVISILAVFLIGLLTFDEVAEPIGIVQFMVSVTHLMAASLILTGCLQLMFTRFIADRLFEHKNHIVLPNLFGVLSVTTLVSGVIGIIIAATLFTGESVIYKVLMLACFVTMSNVWMIVVFMTGLKHYKQILLIFITAYGIAVVSAIYLRDVGLPGLLFGYLIGQAILLFSLLTLVIREYPTSYLVAFDYFDKKKSFYILSITGLFFNLGIWIDKYIFWYNPDTSQAIIGPLRASLIYDLPIFLAYLSIIPGMAVFLVRIETDFVDHYNRFYDSVRDGDSLDHIMQHKAEMIYSVQQGLYDIFKIQGLTIALIFLFAEQILDLLNISPLYIHLLRIDVVAVGMQVILLAILNILFYLDQRRYAFLICAVFFFGNLIFTLVSQQLGPEFYGYGFATSVLVANLCGLLILNRKLSQLEYETFMLR